MLNTMTLIQATDIARVTQILPLLEGCQQLRIFIRQKKVTASVSWQGRKYGSRGIDLPDALTKLVEQVQEIG